MKDLNPYIKTGTYNDFISDASKIYAHHQNNKALLIKFLAAYYASSDNNMCFERDIFGLLDVPEEFHNHATKRQFCVDKEIYTTLAFALKDKKFYKTGEQRGVL